MKKTNNLYILKIKEILKKVVNTFLILVFIFLILSIINYIHISNYSKRFLYSDLSLVPTNKVGLLLGTSPVTLSGNVNLFFKYRMEAAKEIFENKKIEYILVSGDNRTPAYNEPKYMRNHLLKLGINKDAIVPDYAGRRTLDSVLRSNEIFNQNKITIISQKFHNERAIFIARKNGIDAIGYNAKYPYDKYFSNIYINTKIFLRELLARDIAVFDILIGKKPEILGESINFRNENIEGINRLILEEK